MEQLNEQLQTKLSVEVLSLAVFRLIAALRETAPDAITALESDLVQRVGDHIAAEFPAAPRTQRDLAIRNHCVSFSRKLAQRLLTGEPRKMG